MSSYLSFYLVPRAHPEEKLLLQSFSRSNEVYQRFSDNLNIAYAGNEEKYTKLTISDVESVIQDIDADITKAETRRTEYEKFCYGNPESIEEIISAPCLLSAVSSRKMLSRETPEGRIMRRGQSAFAQA